MKSNPPERSKNPDDYGFVYFLKCGEFYKIGISTGLLHRISSLRNANPEKIELVSWAIISKYKDFERMLKLMYKEQNIHGEWFKLTEDQSQVIVGFLQGNNIVR